MVWPTFVVVVVLLSYCQCEAETKISYLTISRYTSARKVYFLPLFLSLVRLVAILFLIFLFLWCPFLFVGTTSWTLAEHCIYNPRQSPRTKFSGQNRVLFWYCKSLNLIGKNEFLFEVVYLPRPGICLVSQSSMLARRSSICRKCTNVCDKYLSEVRNRSSLSDDRKVIKSSQSMRCPFNHVNYHEVFTSQTIKG